jgi:hypothetical protein
VRCNVGEGVRLTKVRYFQMGGSISMGMAPYYRGGLQITVKGITS